MCLPIDRLYLLYLAVIRIYFGGEKEREKEKERVCPEGMGVVVALLI